ncbi:hypothetical protein [Paracoccus methylarcula]|uniref:hypothetical protein n=1 Tax=Paracoccus methylarcula TaxID=72022 RepID=UPI0011CD5CAE|nr:hypothetical protein [Paracoccus methylarcula]
MEKQEVFSQLLGLSKSGLVEFYKYGASDDADIVFIAPEQLEGEVRERPYEVFMTHSDKTHDRLAEIGNVIVS